MLVLLTIRYESFAINFILLLTYWSYVFLALTHRTYITAKLGRWLSSCAIEMSAKFHCNRKIINTKPGGLIDFARFGVGHLHSLWMEAQVSSCTTNSIKCDRWKYFANYESITPGITKHRHKYYATHKTCRSNRAYNKVWWLCLVPTSTTRFAIDMGYRMARMVIQGKYFLWTMTSYSLTKNEEHDIPSQILKTIFGLHASVIF